MPGELARMASKWRIDGVFSDMRIEEMGTSGKSLFCVLTHHSLIVHKTSNHVQIEVCFLFSCPENLSINHLNFYCIKQIDYIFPCVYTVIDHR